MPCPPNELGAVSPFGGIQESVVHPWRYGERIWLAHSGTACRAPTETQRRRNYPIESKDTIIQSKKGGTNHDHRNSNEHQPRTKHSASNS